MGVPDRYSDEWRHLIKWETLKLGHLISMSSTIFSHGYVKRLFDVIREILGKYKTYGMLKIGIQCSGILSQYTAIRIHCCEYILRW